MNKYLISLTVIVIVLVGAYYLLFTNPEALKVSQTPTSTTQTIRIGAFVPLSGDYAMMGESALAGAQLAVKEINDAGGVNGNSIEIVFEDDQCAKDGGVAAATKLIVINEVTAILGSICSSSSEAASTVSQVAGVPMLIAGVISPNPTKAGEYIFRISSTAFAQGKFIAEHIYKTLNKTKVAVVYSKDEWNQALDESFVVSFKELGGKIVYDGGLAVNAGSKEVKDAVAKIKSAKADYIYASILPSINPFLIKELTDAKIKTPVLTVVPKFNNLDDFNNRVKDLTGKDPNLFTPLFYDAVKMLANVMGQTGTDKKSLRNSLVTILYDGGISSVIEFDDSREVKAPAFEVKNSAEAASTATASSTVSSTTP
ncbi:MAG: ABC transporter substrate-binding protein [Patescibacteria group bacterium]